MTNISSSPKKHMHISINNSLPTVNLLIGNPEDDENRTQMLVDTGPAMNTESLEYHSIYSAVKIQDIMLFIY